MRVGPLIRVILVALALAAAATAVAIFVPWLPDQASEEAGRIDFVFWFVTAICIAIFAVVASISVYSLVKFRARPDDDSDGPPIHGHTGIEIAWTVIPLLLVVAMLVVSSVALARNDRVPENHVRVEVLGQQFAWLFAYPRAGMEVDDDKLACIDRDTARLSEECQVSPVLRLPVDQSARLYMTAREVIHSFWVPEFRQKQDLVPGLTTAITITPTKVGTYPVVCTELCGLGHALMRSRAIVMEPAEYAAWRRGD
ncbi:MAG: cytochrome c oxidase subunit II [Actinomycetota bacterium]|nr:cytochrome c oxidase subunit II [Actinomycetota bacterium]